MQPSITHNGVAQQERPIGRSALDARSPITRATGEPDADPLDHEEPDNPELEALEPAVVISPAARLGGLLAVSVIEAVSIYLWLRLHVDGEVWWGLLALLVGEMVETVVLQRFVRLGGLRRWGESAPGPVGAHHLRQLHWRLGIAGNTETAIWVLWVVCVLELGLWEPIAAAGLLVAMHLKHQMEVAAIRDTRFRSGLFSGKGLLGTALEVGGAVACLVLITEGQLLLAAVVLGAGLLLEHFLLIGILVWEIGARDIRLPRDRRWKSPSRPTPALAAYVASHFAPFWRLVQSIGPLQRLLNRVAINRLIGRIEPRPNPLSTLMPYTSWASLTERTYSSRHLPAVSPDAKRPPSPAIEDVARAFLRDDFVVCRKTTVLFTYFAQWLTDGILRTERDGTRVDRDGKPILRDTTKNESNHDIDVAQLYGLNRKATNQLRTGRGLLRSQTINGEEYPPYYYMLDEDGEHVLDKHGKPTPHPDFSELPAPLLPPMAPEAEAEVKKTVFAMGTDTSNLGFIALNVLFLREHNRIAKRLGTEYPAWDDDRVFETARNVLTVLVLKIVVEDYINHINPTYFQFRVAPGSYGDAPWYRQNWVAIEFNLLYRWHCLVPSIFHLDGKPLAVTQLLSNTPLLTSTGLGRLLGAASAQAAGRMCLFNTDSFLVEVAETPSIGQARKAGLASYNDYRRLCRHPPVASFAEISSNPKVQHKLAELYPGGVEDVEFFVGLFAEDLGPNDVLPPLMMTMVAFDAFSQALTNPLLAPRVFNEETFSPAGMKIIKDTSRLSDVVQRNVPAQSEPYFVSMTRRGYKHV
ncbi:MAG TPA: peroxidase family protein [Solirubrobacteraceae bacterium]|nr:peroxidase family protein [Solirubrobacteraceae bacterium]